MSNNTTTILYKGNDATTNIVIAPEVQEVRVTSIGLTSEIANHGKLLGLENDDHLQYLNNTRGDERYPLLDHSHDHTTLTGVAEDQHHAKSHVHDGVDGSGVIESVNVIYDNTASGLQANKTQTAIDELKVSLDSGVIEYAMKANALIAPNNIWDAVNAMDWSGYPHSVGSRLYIQPSHIVTFGNQSDTAFRWVGPKPIYVGKGGTTTIADNFIPIGTANHTLLTNVTPDDHHAQLHAATHFIGGTDALDHDQLVFPTANPHSSMLWKGTWANVEYVNNDVTIDDGWLFIANTTTIERPAPQPINTPSNIVDDNTIWEQLTNSTRVFSGIEATVPAGKMYKILSYRLWATGVTDAYTYILWHVSTDNAGKQFFTKIIEVLGSKIVAGWNSFNIAGTLLSEGTKFSLVLDTLNSSAQTVITGGWTAEAASNNAAPPTKSWNANTSNTIVRIDILDLDTVDRQTELLSIISGAEIQFVSNADNNRNITYIVTADPVLVLNHIEYEVVLSTEGPTGAPSVGEVTTLTATIDTPAVTDYVQFTGGFTGFPNIQGTLSLTGTYTDSVVSENTYGIDMEVQEYSVSTEWDLLASPGEGSGSSSGNGELTDAPEDGTEYLRKNGIWVNPAAVVANNNTGYKNVIINGRLGPSTISTVYPWIINQRGFNGDWGDAGLLVGDYGFDRWRASAAYQPEQLIEDVNILDGEIYTLSWDSPTTNGAGSITNTAGPIRSGISPLTGAISGPGVIVEVPRDATHVQLELGSAPTQFEIRPIGLELQLCQRYFYSSYPIGSAPGDIVSSAIAFSTAGFSTKWVPFPMQWPVPMRISPQFKIYSPDTGAVNKVRDINGTVDLDVNGFWNLFNTQAMGMVFTVDSPQNTRFSFNYTLDAEIT